MAPALRSLITVITACYGLWIHSGVALAEEAHIAVIVSSQTPRFSVNRATLRQIYLKKIFLDAQGHTLVPVNLPPDNPLRHAFSDAAIHMSDIQLRTYWNRRYFQGVSPPYVLGSENAVVQFVAQTPGAVGYVRLCYVDASVHSVLLLSVPVAEMRGMGTQCP